MNFKVSVTNDSCIHSTHTHKGSLQTKEQAKNNFNFFSLPCTDTTFVVSHNRTSIQQTIIFA